MVLRVVRCSEVAWTLVHMLSQFPTAVGLGEFDAPLSAKKNTLGLVRYCAQLAGT